MNLKTATISMAFFGRFAIGQTPTAIRGGKTAVEEPLIKVDPGFNDHDGYKPLDEVAKPYPKSGGDEPGSYEEYQWPMQEDIRAEVSYVKADEDEHGRKMTGANCGIFTGDNGGSYFHPVAGSCYNLGGNWWNDKITFIRASGGTCVDIWQHHEGGRHKRHCGSDWLELGGDMSRQASRVCCVATTSQAKQTPVTSCTGNGGTCGCGKTTDGHVISMNRYWGDNNDEKVWGCGGAFQLTGASWNSQWGGTLSQASSESKISHDFGLGFSQSASFDGWEGCCRICGANLQMAGKISDGWYCEKDFFSTGIWLKGKNK